MNYHRDDMDFSRHDNKAYFMVGHLVSNGEIVGEWFVGLPCFVEKICLGGALPETVDVKMADMDDFCNQHITYGVFGDKELNEVSFESREVIDEVSNRLLQLDLHEYPHKLESERIDYDIHYIDTAGEYKSIRVKSLEEVLNALIELDGVTPDWYTPSKAFKLYLEFNSLIERV